MPSRAPRTRAQFTAFVEQRITDPLNQQNTAQIVRTVFEECAYSWFNRAEDQLSTGEIAGLEEFIAAYLAAYLPSGGGGTITLTGITEFRDRFNDTFSGTLQQFATALLVKEQFPTYVQPAASLASTQAGQVERGTTITPTLTPAFAPGDAGALTSYELRRGTTVLAADSAAPIAYPAVADSYKIGLETITYTATFGYAQGAQKTSSQGNVAPGRVEAGSKQAQVTVQGVAKIFYGPAAAVPTNSAQVRALATSQLETQGNQFTLNTGSTSNRFLVWLPQGKTITSVVDQDALNADITSQYVPGALSVNDAGGTPVAGNLFVMSPAVPYSSSHRHLITTN